jgi:predicted PurR-regulated permease PerM
VAGVTARQTARNVLTTLAIVGVLYVLWLVRDVVLIVLLAAFVAAALTAPVRFLESRTPLPRAAAILVVYLFLLGLIALIGFIIVPPLVHQIEEFARHVPQYVRDLESNATIRKWDHDYGIISKLEGEASKLPTLLSDAAGELESITVGIVERIVKTIAVLAIAFLLLLDAPRTLGLVYGRMPSDRAARARRLADQASQAITGYVVGAFSVAFLAGLVSFLAMEIIGIPFAIPLAVLMAFFALIPLVGSSIGAIAIAIVAAFQGLDAAIEFVVFFIVYQQLETHVLGPFVYKRTVAMRPVLVIISVFVGASLLGILGALLAIPAAATIQLVITDWWRTTHPDAILEAAAPEPAPAPAPDPA